MTSLSVRRFERLFLFLFLITDYLAILASFVIAYFVRRTADVASSLDIVEIPVLNFAFRDFMRIAPIIALGWLAIFALTNRYRHIQRRGGLEEFYSVFQASSIGVLAMMIMGFFIGRQLFSRLITIYAWLISILLIYIGRMVIHQIQQYFWKKQIGVYRILVCGAGKIGRQFLEGIRQQGWPGYHVVGVLNQQEKQAREAKRLSSGPIIQDDRNRLAGFPYLGSYRQLDAVLRNNILDEVIVGLGKFDDATTTEIVMTCQHHGVRVSFFPDMLTISAGYKVTDTINGIPLMRVTRNALRGWNALSKRLLDVLVSVLTTLILAPLLLLLALLVRLSSPGPVIYSQPRIGRDGQPFSTYKFRTMRHNAENATGQKWTVQDDRRRTAIGSFLRKSQLDELPQLWNILRGDMSLVGPRPEQADFVNEFKTVIPRYEERHQIKPGLTGWAQVNGWRGNTSIEERLQYDLFYIENWSFLFDLKILFQTLKSLFNAKGAY